MAPITLAHARKVPVVLALWSAFLLAGCAAPPPGERVSYVAAIGTPFYVALKIPACVATVALAGPGAALQGLAAPGEDGTQPDIRPILDRGIASNCGPPYILPPE